MYMCIARVVSLYCSELYDTIGVGWYTYARIGLGVWGLFRASGLGFGG